MRIWTVAEKPYWRVISIDDSIKITDFPLFIMASLCEDPNISIAILDHYQVQLTAALNGVDRYLGIARKNSIAKKNYFTPL